MAPASPDRRCSGRKSDGPQWNGRKNRGDACGYLYYCSLPSPSAAHLVCCCCSCSSSSCFSFPLLLVVDHRLRGGLIIPGREHGSSGQRPALEGVDVGAAAAAASCETPTSPASAMAATTNTPSLHLEVLESCRELGAEPLPALSSTRLFDLARQAVTTQRPSDPGG